MALEQQPRARPGRGCPCCSKRQRGPGCWLCPIPAARASGAALLLCCLLDSGVLLAPGVSSSRGECSRSPCSLPARSREVGVVSEMLLAEAEQVSGTRESVARLRAYWDPRQWRGCSARTAAVSLRLPRGRRSRGEVGAGLAARVCCILSEVVDVEVVLPGGSLVGGFLPSASDHPRVGVHLGVEAL
jgi:hypothetical protein